MKRSLIFIFLMLSLARAPAALSSAAQLEALETGWGLDQNTINLSDFTATSGTAGAPATATQSGPKLRGKVHSFQPYVRTKAGPIYLGIEATWMVRQNTQDGLPATPEQDISTKNLWIDSRYDRRSAYLGCRFIYNSSGDLEMADRTAGNLSGIFGYARDKAAFGDISTLRSNLYALTLKGNEVAAQQIISVLDNSWLYQIYGGYSPTMKIDLMASYQMQKADEGALAAGGQSRNYGSGLDIRAIYKIDDALTYNVGAAFRWSGDHFKGTPPTVQVKNTYMLMHWLDLRF